MMDNIDIYTDGSCHKKTGGYGIVIIREDSEPIEISGGVLGTTNVRMEMYAVIVALEKVYDKSNINVYTDSQLIVDGMTDWIYAWMKNRWRKATRGTIKNRDLWEHLYERSQYHNIVWNHVKGHSGDKYNDIAHLLAKRGREEQNTIFYERKIR